MTSRLPTTYDFIIAGAGASGLGLLWDLLQSHSLQYKRILLIDQTFSPSSHKTWSFWSGESIPFSPLVYHSWPALRIGIDGSLREEVLQRYRYHCIRSEDYSAAILQKARQHPTVSLLEADILDFSSRDETAFVHTSKGDFRAAWIFQSALRPPGFGRSRVDNSLIQHFLGWEVEVNRPVFDPSKATFMDFNTPQKNGLTFFYLLPFSDHKALVEYTLFSPELLSGEEYESAIRTYLHETLEMAPEEYKITRVEKGTIPMEDRRYPALWCPRVFNTGTIGGLTKPSTGYTFTRIHKHNRAIVHALENGKIPPRASGSSYRFRVYDMLLLWLLVHRPDSGLEIFRCLFENNSLEDLLCFLNEETHPGRDLKILWSVPSEPFLQAVWKMKHRIITGA